MAIHEILGRLARHTAVDGFLHRFAQLDEHGDAAGLGHGRLKNGHLLDRDPMRARDRRVEVTRDLFAEGVMLLRPLQERADNGLAPKKSLISDSVWKQSKTLG